jgi:hypothetical protein
MNKSVITKIILFGCFFGFLSQAYSDNTQTIKVTCDGTSVNCKNLIYTWDAGKGGFGSVRYNPDSETEGTLTITLQQNPLDKNYYASLFDVRIMDGSYVNQNFCEIPDLEASSSSVTGSANSYGEFVCSKTINPLTIRLKS